MKKIYILIFLLLSQNLYSQWTIQQEGVSVSGKSNTLFFTSKDTGYVTAWNGRLYKTTNGGTNWNYQTIAPDLILTSVCFVNQTTGYISATSGKWFKTTDAGNTFTMNSNAGYAGSLMDIFFINPDIGWCVGGNGSGSNFVSRTNNGGLDWNVQRTFSEQNTPFTVFFLNADTGFTDCGNKIWLTTNGGTNWNIQYDPNTYITHFYFKNNTGYAVGTNSTILKSTNHGFNWSTLVSPISNRTLWQSYFLDENTGWIVGDSGLILYTTNGGSNFVQQESGTTRDLVSLFFINEKGWCVGANRDTLQNGIILAFNSDINLNIKLVIEGMYYPIFSQMSRKDTLSVYLRETTNPYAIIDSARNIIDSITFSANFTFENAVSGTYYIVVNHLNSIETWSRPGGEYLISNGSTYNYDFTDSQTKAFGNNLALVNTKWCLYSGDADQNGFVNLDDLIMVYNDASNFIPGYISTDLNGDNIVNLSDLLIAYNNVSKFVEIVRP